MTYPPVVIVDDHDRVIGEAPLQKALEERLIHRIVLIVIENEQGEVLLQRRAAGMQLHPGCWDISAGGHVDDGHDYAEAAHLEVEEELGLSGIELEEVAYFYTEDPYPGYASVRRYVKIYRAHTEALPYSIEKAEVSAVQWFSMEELSALVDRQPEKVAAGLLLAFEHVLSKEVVSIT